MSTLKCQDEGKGQKKVDTRTFINFNFPILQGDQYVLVRF